ncbi:hypothetical protein [Taylorella asinigenitalis]|uniref:hypothetical protein n=1 Tax=Taylorella asinigenitalis TaxID=84590 RepID=UPI00048B17AA|nr:hypothetical protein [Taylorella asinigenitalis]
MDIKRLVPKLVIFFYFVAFMALKADAKAPEADYPKEILFATCLASQNLDVFREQGEIWLEELRKNDQNNSKNFDHLFENSVQIISSLPIPYFSVTKDRYQEPDRFYTNPLFVCHRYVDLFANERPKNFSMYELLFKGIETFYEKNIIFVNCMSELTNNSFGGLDFIDGTEADIKLSREFKDALPLIQDLIKKDNSDMKSVPAKYCYHFQQRHSRQR